MTDTSRTDENYHPHTGTCPPEGCAHTPRTDEPVEQLREWRKSWSPYINVPVKQAIDDVITEHGSLRVEVEQTKKERTYYFDQMKVARAEVEALRAVLETREDMIDAAHAEVERLSAALEDEETLRNDTEMERDELRAALRGAKDQASTGVDLVGCRYCREVEVRTRRALTTQEER